MAKPQAPLDAGAEVMPERSALREIRRARAGRRAARPAGTTSPLRLRLTPTRARIAQREANLPTQGRSGGFGSTSVATAASRSASGAPVSPNARCRPRRRWRRDSLRPEPVTGDTSCAPRNCSSATRRSNGRRREQGRVFVDVRGGILPGAFVGAQDDRCDCRGVRPEILTRVQRAVGVEATLR